MTEYDVAIIDNLKLVFKKYDKNNDGVIDRKELRHLCRSLGEPLTTNELDCAYSLLDENNSGKIEIAEFIDYWLNK